MIHVGRAEQPAVQRVGPAMIRALNASAESAFRGRTQPGAPVTADVVKSFDRAGIAANHDNTFARDLAQEVIAATGYAIGAPRTDPTSEKEVVHLLTEERAVCVIARRKMSSERYSRESPSRCFKW